MDRQGRRAPSAPRQQYFVGGNTKFYGAILFRLRERDFGEVAPLRRRLAGVAARPTRTSSPTTPRPSASTSSTASAARTRPSRRLRARSPTRPSRTSRASSSCTTTSRGPGTTRSTCRSASTSTSPIRRPGRCVRCDRFDGFPCLTDGKADAHVLLRAAGARASPNVTLRDARQGRAARDRRVRAAASPRWSSTAAAPARPTAATSSSSPAAPSTRRRCCCARPTTSTRTAWPTRSDLVGPQLHGPHQLGRDRDLRRRRTRRSSRRRSGVNDYYWGADDSELPARAHPDARQERPATSCGRARRGSPPGFALDYMASTRSTSGSPPRTCRTPTTASRVDRDGRIHLAKTYHNEEAHRRLLAQAQGAARASSAATEHLIPQLPRSSTSASRWRGSPTSAARCASATTRRRRCSTSTARPTSSTTSTSSTRASSPRRAR